MNDFIAQQATEWEGNLTGAVGGTFWPNAWAEEILGKLDYGRVLAYLYRRFGFTGWGSDPYKDICEYVLTTPMSGVYLGVIITTHIAFSYLLTEAIDKQCLTEQRKPREEWGSRMLTWAEGQDVRLYHIFITPHDVLDEAFTAWVLEHHPTVEASEENRQRLANEFITSENAKYEQYSDRYATEIEPYPDINVFAAASEGNLRWQVEQAIRATMEDLLRVVCVRDVWINIKGVCEPSGEYDASVEAFTDAVEPSPMAGNGVPISLYNDKAALWDLVKEVGRVGIHQAIERLRTVGTAEEYG